MASVMTLMTQLIAEMRSAQTGVERESALKSAEMLEQILVKTMPENKQPPLISVYSYAEGERDRPKPALKCKMSWVGYDIKVDTMTPAEIDLLNRLQPGVYRVKKADLSLIEFRVTAVHDSNLELERLDIWFPCKGQDRHNHGTLLSYCHQALGTALASPEELYAEVLALKAQLATATGVTA